MHSTAMAFACSALTTEYVTGRRVVEAGALDVNGSVRAHVMQLAPASYIGVDMRAGPGVDVVMDAANLPPGQSDVVVSTEMLEHAPDWRAAMRGMISALAEGGLLVLTTRSPGFPRHDYPGDHWRFPVPAMGAIAAAAGLETLRLEADPQPGVFLAARKPAAWSWPDVAPAWDEAGVVPVDAQEGAPR